MIGFRRLGLFGLLWVGSSVCAFQGMNPNQTCQVFLRGKLNADLRNVCPPNDQGHLATCWANSGVQYLKTFLLRHGLMEPNENLSVDYYSALVIKATARQFFHHSRNISADELGSFNFAQTFGMLASFGKVLDHQFRFPRFSYYTDKTVRKVDVRSNQYYWNQMVKELNHAKRNKNEEEFDQVLNRYLGDEDQITGVPIPPSILQQNWPALFTTRSNQVQFFGLDQDSRTPVQVVSAAELTQKIRTTLDQNQAISITFKLLPDDEDPFTHAMALVGYGKEIDGTFWYLLQNSKGKKWGENGVIPISEEYLLQDAVGVLAPAK